MKTEVIMYRELHGIQFHQAHKTQFINITEVIDNFNKNQGDILNVGISTHLEAVDFKKKQLREYWRTASTKGFIVELASHLNCLPENLIATKRGKKGGTWVHPYIFLDVCMWLSPKFKVAALAILNDNLLELRDQSGDEYKALCRAMDENGLITDHWDYARVAKAITFAVLGTIEKEQWNHATEQQLQQRKDMEGFLAQAITAGFITSLAMIFLTIDKRRNNNGLL